MTTATRPRRGGSLTERDYQVLAGVFGFDNKEQMQEFAEMEQLRADVRTIGFPDARARV